MHQGQPTSASNPSPKQGSASAPQETTNAASATAGRVKPAPCLEGTCVPQDVLEDGVFWFLPKTGEAARAAKRKQRAELLAEYKENKRYAYDVLLARELAATAKAKN